MADRRDLYPGYDVLSKRNTPSWNEQTRRVVDERLALGPDTHRFFTDAESPIMQALAERMVPQADARRAPIPVAAMVDDKLHQNALDGYRPAALPPLREAWRRGLAALDTEARGRHGAAFPDLDAAEQDGLIRDMQEGRLSDPAWGGMPPKDFFKHRVVHDVVRVYYAHPSAWNEVGFGGPASPRGYVRMDRNRRDGWEAAEAKPGREDEAYRENKRVGR